MLVRYNSVFVPLCSPNTFQSKCYCISVKLCRGLVLFILSVCLCVCFPYSGTSRNQAYKQQFSDFSAILQRDTGMKYKKGFFFKNASFRSSASRNQAYKQQFSDFSAILQRDTGMKYKKGFFFKNASFSYGVVYSPRVAPASFQGS